MARNPRTKPKIRLLHGLARCGGTLISRCLGAMDGIALLSEIHPKGLKQFHPMIQAQAWYGLFDKSDLAKFAAAGDLPYADMVALIAQRFDRQRRVLILRDWSHLDFHGLPFVESPPGKPTHAHTLSRRFAVLTAAIVRHPLDQWQSIRRLAVIQDRIDLPAYLRGYRLFAENAAHMPHIRYEDFTADPDTALRHLCAALEAPFDPGYAGRWARYANVTGDLQQGPGADATEILPAQRHKPEAALLAAVADNADYRRALEILGYDHPA